MDVKRPALLQTKVWEAPVVISHWAMAISITVLCITGYLVSDPAFSAPSEAAKLFDMGKMRFYHLLSAYVLMAAFLLRFYWGFVGNRFSRWTTLLPIRKRDYTVMKQEVVELLWPRLQFKTYTGHAPMAHVSYIGVYVMVVLASFTGLIMHAQAHYTPLWRWFGAMGLWVFGDNLNTVRFIHHALLWLFVAFFIVHLYLVVYSLLVSHTTEVDAMISGNKFTVEEEQSEYEQPYTVEKDRRSRTG